MMEFVTLRPKGYNCLINDGDENKKGKLTKKCIMKKNLYSKIIKLSRSKSIWKLNKPPRKKNYIEVDGLRKDHIENVKNNRLMLKPLPRFGNEKDNVFTEEVSKIALSANDGKKYNQPIL